MQFVLFLFSFRYDLFFVGDDHFGFTRFQWILFSVNFVIEPSLSIQRCRFLFHQKSIQNILNNLFSFFLFRILFDFLCRVPWWRQQRWNVFWIARHFDIFNKSSYRVRSLQSSCSCSFSKQFDQLFKRNSCLSFFQAFFDRKFKVNRIPSWNRIEFAQLYSFVKLVHASASERRSEATQFVYDAAKRPYIALCSVA